MILVRVFVHETPLATVLPVWSKRQYQKGSFMRLMLIMDRDLVSSVESVGVVCQPAEWHETLITGTPEPLPTSEGQNPGQEWVWPSQPIGLPRLASGGSRRLLPLLLSSRP